MLVFLIFTAFIQSCNQSPESISHLLEGQWRWIGFYENNQPLYDTLYIEVNDSFEPSHSSATNVFIWTDSGTYIHQYRKDSLIGISPSRAIPINEYIFADSQTGTVLDYGLNPDHRDNEHPRITALEQTFRIEGKILILIDSDVEVEIEIEKITADELILIKDGKTSRFEKYRK